MPDGSERRVSSETLQGRKTRASVPSWIVFPPLNPEKFAAHARRDSTLLILIEKHGKKQALRCVELSGIVGMHALENIPERKIHPDIRQPDFSIKTGIFD